MSFSEMQEAFSARSADKVWKHQCLSLCQMIQTTWKFRGPLTKAFRSFSRNPWRLTSWWDSCNPWWRAWNWTTPPSSGTVWVSCHFQRPADSPMYLQKPVQTSLIPSLNGYVLKEAEWYKSKARQTLQTAWRNCPQAPCVFCHHWMVILRNSPWFFTCFPVPPLKAWRTSGSGMATCKQLLLLLPSHGNALSSLEKSDKKSDSWNDDELIYIYININYIAK